MLLAGPLNNNYRTWSSAKPNNGLSWSFPGAFPEFPGLQTGCSTANLKILGFKYPAPHIPKRLTGLGASYFAQNTFPDEVLLSANVRFSETQEIVKSLRGVLQIGWFSPGVLDLLDWTSLGIRKSLLVLVL